MRRRRPMRASVQRSFLQVQDISGNMLCLSSPTASAGREYRAVLEVSAINFTLKAEEEQEAIIAGYGALLKALTFPIQILVRNQRLDLHPYRQRILEAVPTDEGDITVSASWQVVASSLAAYVQTLASQRTLIERHCYLVIPAPTGSEPGRRFPAQLRSLLPGPHRRRKRSASSVASREKARQDLEIRVQMVTQHLTTIGLRCRRLSGDELARFYHRCLTPERAITHPLSDAILASVGRPQRVRAGSKREASTSSPEHGSPPPTREKSESVPAVPTPDLLHLLDLVAPASIEVMPDAVCLEGSEYTRGIAITALPREVAAGGWLAPLVFHHDIVDLVLHLHPQDSALMLRHLKRRLAGYVSAERLNQRHGKMADPELQVAQADVQTLLHQLASGEERILDLGWYVLVRASDRRTLDERTDRMAAVLTLLGVGSAAHVATFEQAQALRSCLPEARDELMRTITLDTASLATMFPFLSNALAMPDGVLIGLTGADEPVLLDAWDESLETPHTFIGGVTGSGKSYLGKLLIARDLLLHGRSGGRILVIDLDQEYLPLAAAFGGSVIRIAPGSPHHLNPFDLLPLSNMESFPSHEIRHGDRLAEKVQDLHSLLDILLAERLPAAGVQTSEPMLSTREKGLLDRALYETYRRMGITADPRTHDRQPPLLRDLYEVLQSGVCGPDEYDLAPRLFRYVHGSLAGLFSSQTDVDLNTHLVVWDLQDMSRELRPVGMFLIAECVWTQVASHSQIPRSLYIDEAASLIEYPEGGRFFAMLSRRARKRYLRLVTMTQNPELFVQDTWGSVIATNAATKILKMQDRTSIAAVSERFHLTKGEQHRLLTLGKAEALLLAGDRRVILAIHASPHEHDLITTNPVELAERTLPHA